MKKEDKLKIRITIHKNNLMTVNVVAVEDEGEVAPLHLGEQVLPHFSTPCPNKWRTNLQNKKTLCHTSDSSPHLPLFSSPGF